MNKNKFNDDLDKLSARNLTSQEIQDRLATLAWNSAVVDIEIDEHGRNADCNYPEEVTPDGLPLNDQ